MFKCIDAQFSWTEIEKYRKNSQSKQAEINSKTKVHEKDPRLRSLIIKISNEKKKCYA